MGKDSTPSATRPPGERGHPVPSIIGVLFALGFAYLPISRWEDEFASTAHLVGYEVIWWTAVAAVLLHVRLLERRPLGSIGFRRFRASDAGLAIAAAFATLAGLSLIYYVVLPRLGVNETREVDRLIATPLWWRIISVIRAGVSEEVMFRGYAIERLRELSGSLRLAGAVSWVAFTIAHVGTWGWGHVLIAGYGGLVLTALYLWRRSLWTTILAHCIVDGVAVLAA